MNRARDSVASVEERILALALMACDGDEGALEVFQDALPEEYEGQELDLDFGSSVVWKTPDGRILIPRMFTWQSKWLPRIYAARGLFRGWSTEMWPVAEWCWISRLAQIEDYQDGVMAPHIAALEEFVVNTTAAIIRHAAIIRQRR